MPSRILIAVALSTVTGVALAQITPPAPATTPAPAAQTTTPAPAQQSNAQSGFRTANTATVAVRFTTMKPSDLMSSRLIGLNVYNNQNESLGEIEDLVIENGKTITGVVVSVWPAPGFVDTRLSESSLLLELHAVSKRSWVTQLGALGLLIPLGLFHVARCLSDSTSPPVPMLPMDAPGLPPSVVPLR